MSWNRNGIVLLDYCLLPGFTLNAGWWTELEGPRCHCKSYIYSNTSILMYPSNKYIMTVNRVLLISIHITRALHPCVAPALNTAWQSTGRFFIHISGFTYNFIYNVLRLNLRNHGATASHLFIALSKHLMHQNCHKGAQNKHKQLASCSCEMVLVKVPTQAPS